MWVDYLIMISFVVLVIWFVLSNTSTPTELEWRKKMKYYSVKRFEYMKRMDKELEDWRS